MANKKFNRKIIKPIVIVVIVVAGAAGAGLFVQWLQATVFKGSGDSSQQTPPLDDAAYLPKTIIESRDLLSQDKFEESNQKLEQALQSATSDEEKYLYHFQIGATYDDQGQHQKAIDSYRQAATLQETWAVYKAIGMSAELMGDKKLANENYQKAITLLDPESPMYEAEKRRIEKYITGLEG